MAKPNSGQDISSAKNISWSGYTWHWCSNMVVSCLVPIEFMRRRRRIYHFIFACKGKHGTRCSPPLFITTSILHAHRLHQKEKETFRRKDTRICLIGLV